jgi:hypothetical protein
MWMRDPEKELETALVTMSRVRRNAELLKERLTALGWVALSGEMVGSPSDRPFPGEAEAEAVGATPFPVSIVAFWRVVGGLDFVWDYNRGRNAPDIFGGLTIFQLDPLYVEGPSYLPYAAAEWRDRIDVGDTPKGGPFRLGLAPDNYHKDNYSGGSPYGVTVPELCADPLFGGDDFQMRFTNYLRLSFRWGGFPGLAVLPTSSVISKRVIELTEGFEPF